MGNVRSCTPMHMHALFYYQNQWEIDLDSDIIVEIDIILDA